MFSFRKLDVYNAARVYVKSVYEIMKSFPKEERFALSDQLRRSAISVPSNIAEGMGRRSKKEQIHFIEIAFGSLMESFCQLELAFDLEYIDKETFEKSELQVEHFSKMLSGLTVSIEKKLSRKTKSITKGS